MFIATIFGFSFMQSRQVQPVVASGTFDCSSQVLSREKPVSMPLNDQNNLYHGVVIHLQCIYCDTHKTVKTRNINYVMLLC